ncbi:hypothetical protein PSECIP111951_01658 [Pseudoalteromonas holothuriae]|uniref:Uncharacterized protein n=1 Tax=Pseudoalteromonas holothuriae TaxID=2963714 RepID=A0A9W4VW81_9GAMM|nr:hypothetical protein PSECIP111854_00847 [Pseudoalteromonas sp. CIP111854]CAH9057389.1 hypothetical protein PSECIP111951_01658 [Pseudoalteromonas sp. CIP111951]
MCSSVKSTPSISGSKLKSIPNLTESQRQRFTQVANAAAERRERVNKFHQSNHKKSHKSLYQKILCCLKKW